MTYIDDLKTARDQIADQIKDLTLNPKPTYTIDGQTVKWTEHFSALVDRLEKLDKAINSAEPYEAQSIGYN